MPLSEATPLPTSGRRTVSYRNTSGETKNATMTDTSTWKADTGVDYGALTNVTLTIDSSAISTVDLAAVTDLATAIAALNGDVDFGEAATATDSTTDPGRLIITADDPGEHIVAIGGIAGAMVGELHFGHPLEDIAEVPLATGSEDTEVYFHRLAPTGN